MVKLVVPPQNKTIILKSFISLKNPDIYLLGSNGLPRYHVTSPDDIIINQDKISILIKKPMLTETIHTIASPNNSYFTSMDLVLEISKLYEQIYQEESNTSTQPEESFEEYEKRTGEVLNTFMGTRNRVPSDGIYKITFWFLENLYLTSVYKYDNESFYRLEMDT